jgi:hypothetical protein
MGGAGGCCRDERRALALRQLGRAHVTGALAAAARGLGDLDPNTIFPDRTDIDREEAAFDSRVNAWMVDYQRAFAKIPASVSQQVDDWITRWRNFHGGWYIVGRSRVSSILAFQAEWNRLKDQVAGYGATSAVQAATVEVDGKTVRADQIPPETSNLARIESIAKWAALLVGGIAAWKVANDLGVVGKVKSLVFGGGGGGGGLVRRFGSAKRPNPRKRNDLARPAGLSAAGNAAHAAIVRILRKHGLTWTGGCKAFYSPAEWAARGEKYGLRSELVVVYDGGFVGEAIRIDGQVAPEVERALKKLGLYPEESTNWYGAIFPIG